MSSGDSNSDADGHVVIEAYWHEPQVRQQEAHLESPDTDDIAFGVLVLTRTEVSINMSRAYKGAPIYWIRPKL